ncbi:shootin-1-like [Macadamia integrifolia]|uniref:shootin-1-like n=1 Tax=Macadamia integrifolia TaxID=60698 RepID=UPI001C4F7000|nr:shootin-1-like [Macadamia integrifolia]
MKQMDVDCKVGGVKTPTPMGCPLPPPPPPPPPLPPLPRSWAAIKPAGKTSSVESVTKQEIARFWMQKRMKEEDHLLSALKAAAIIRARNLTEEDYKLFEKSLKDDTTNAEKEDEGDNISSAANKEREVRVGIKDWWTKSKYAYLNQPAIERMAKQKRSTYIPHNFCFYKSPSPTTPAGPCITFGVF